MEDELVKKLFDETWNYPKREDILGKLKTTEYDIIVIGGGITGAGVAREAAMRGLRVALLEMQDFASGTSSRSSKLAHGGIRYLANGELRLVREATTERNWLRNHLPHIVRPIPFLFIDWEEGKEGKFLIKAATTLYDILSDWFTKFRNFKKHKWFPSEKVFEFEPEIKKNGNNGGAIYYDNNMDDARITLEVLKEARIRNAEILNYCKVMGYIKEDGVIKGVACKDLEYENEFEVKGKLVVNATGIWTDEQVDNYPEDIPEPVIRPTKGVHIQYRRKDVGNEMATIIRSITDDRAFFVLPREDHTIIGTTDTDYKGDLTNPFCTREDAEYLIKSVKHYFPNAKLDINNLISTYAGIRPLVMQKGKSESKVSRDHLIFWSKDGLLTITGGKFTTFRKMAEDLFQEIVAKEIFTGIDKKKGFSKQVFKISIDKDDWKDLVNAIDLELDKDILDYLYRQYGRGSIEILKLIKENNSLATRVDEENDFILGEIIALFSLIHTSLMDDPEVQ
ncbi:MAG: glycerol-3-phosphate dehydrogenase/oxidase [Candidatus Lokiarchaeota archaeon]